MKSAGILQSIVLSAAAVILSGAAYYAGAGAGGLQVDPAVCRDEKGVPEDKPMRASVANGNALQGDGMGDYINAAQNSAVHAHQALDLFTVWRSSDVSSSHRFFKVDLSHPVAGGGGINRGVITTGNNGTFTVNWSLDRTVSPFQLHSSQSIPVGATVYSDQTMVMFIDKADNNAYAIQIGPWARNDCMTANGPFDGSGTSRAIITRINSNRWNVKLEPGSVVRLFNYNNKAKPISLGLYNFSFSVDFAYL